MSAFPQPGEIFNNRYELLEVLGTGGVGTVFKALQIESKRKIALKILHRELVSDDDFRKRFVAEAKALNQLSHPGIVTVYHIGISETGLPYIAMELVRGKSVKVALKESGKFPALRAVHICKQAAEALAYVHSQGIVHRDLKPENLITLDIPEPDTVKVIDFGLARIAQDQHSTRTGTIIGSIEYMSPEQCLGKTADARSDIYSLCVCFFQMLTGKKPYRAENAVGVLYQQTNSEIPKIEASQVDRFDPAINAVIAKGMAKSAQDRFQTMEEFVVALKALSERLESRPSKDSVMTELQKKSFWKSKPGLALLGVMLLSLTAGIWIIQLRKAEMKTELDAMDAMTRPNRTITLYRAVDILKEIEQKHWKQQEGKSEAEIINDPESVKRLKHYLSDPAIEPPAKCCLLLGLSWVESDPAAKERALNFAYSLATLQYSRFEKTLSPNTKNKSNIHAEIRRHHSLEYDQSREIYLTSSAAYISYLIESKQCERAVELCAQLLPIAEANYSPASSSSSRFAESGMYYNMYHLQSLNVHTKMGIKILMAKAFLCQGDKENADKIIKELLPELGLDANYIFCSRAEREFLDLLISAKTDAELKKVIAGLSTKRRIGILLEFSNNCFWKKRNEAGEMALKAVEPLILVANRSYYESDFCLCQMRRIEYLLSQNHKKEAKLSSEKLVSYVCDESALGTANDRYMSLSIVCRLFYLMMRQDLKDEAHRVIIYWKPFFLNISNEEFNACFNSDLKPYADDPEVVSLVDARHKSRHAASPPSQAR